MYGCTKKYHCASDFYLLSCITLDICIIIKRENGALGNGKYFVGGLNSRDKWIIQLAIVKILNSELICDDPNFYKFMQVHENE